MLPHKHFLIAAAAAAPFSLNKPEWMLVSGLVAAAIDMDVVVLVWVNSKKQESLRQFKNPLNIFSGYQLFLKTIWETGVLKTALKTHFILSALLLAAAFLFFRGLMLPVTAGVITHLLSDLPLMGKAFGAGPGKPA